jgi:hypothetical protein
VRTLTVEARCAAAAGVALMGAFLLGVTPLIPPDPLTPDAPPAAFSAGRAIEHVRVVAAAPHPVGSPRQIEVAAYIQQEIGELGLTSAVQETRATVSRRGTPARDVTVRNILATIPGTRSRKALLLGAHYDSAPNSPGASDNGAAVATLLETARAVRAGAPLGHDVMFLFTDGEEAGLLGAKAFVTWQPHAAAVATVLNFDARGRTGPVVMFETAGPNLSLVSRLSRSVPQPIATSLSEDVYRRMPNRTDFTTFRDSRLAGLNFAFFAEPRVYHSASDTIQNLDPRTLQHQGTSALALTRALGNDNLPLTGTDRAVYFNIGRSILLYYPAGWTLPLVTLTGLIALISFAFALRTRLLTLRDLLLGTLALIASVIVSLLIGVVVSRTLAGVLGARGSVGAGARYLAIVAGLTALCAFAIYHLASKRVSLAGLIVPVHAGWTLAAIALAISVPGASYLFLWPALIGVLLQVPLILRLRRAQPVSPFLRVALTLPIVPAVILLTPAIGLIYSAIGPSIVTPVAALCAGLMSALCVPALTLTTATWLRPAVGASASSTAPGTARA